MTARVQVRFLLHFETWAGTKEAFVQADTLGELLAKVQRDCGLEDRILDGARTKPWTRVLLNGRDAFVLNGLETRLAPGDRVALVFPFMESG